MRGRAATTRVTVAITHSLVAVTPLPLSTASISTTPAEGLVTR
jgi:hypothetical protein